MSRLGIVAASKHFIRSMLPGAAQPCLLARPVGCSDSRESIIESHRARCLCLFASVGCDKTPQVNRSPSCEDHEWDHRLLGPMSRPISSIWPRTGQDRSRLDTNQAELTYKIDAFDGSRQPLRRPQERFGMAVKPFWEEHYSIARDQT